MEGVLLTIAGGEGAEGAVLPRRAELELRPGTGRLDLAGVPAPDAAWVGSVRAGWEAALLLAGRGDRDARLRVAATAPLRGASAGLPLGLLALGGLLDVPLPAFLATGGITDPSGYAIGGRAALAKAEAAAQLAPQLPRRPVMFLAPPLAAPPRVALQVGLAADLGTALLRLDPGAYARVAARHQRLRAAPGTAGPFARVRGPGPAPSLPSEVGGIAVAWEPAPGLPRGAWVDLGDRGLTLWRTFLPDAAALPGGLPGLMALARACAAP